MKNNPKVTLAVPFHWMANWERLLLRCLISIEAQSFKDYEIILYQGGTMPVSSNRTIQAAKGDIIKVLYMDDYFTTAHSLQEIVDNFKGGWLVTGCSHDYGQSTGNYHGPSSEGIKDNKNTIGSPSVIAFENRSPELFDENMSWLLDLDLYQRLLKRYGEPMYLDTPNVSIGVHGGQMSNILTEEQKQKEFDYLIKKNK